MIKFKKTEQRFFYILLDTNLKSHKVGKNIGWTRQKKHVSDYWGGKKVKKKRTESLRQVILKNLRLTLVGVTLSTLSVESCLRIVVFPALSNPSRRILISCPLLLLKFLMMSSRPIANAPQGPLVDSPLGSL